MNEKIKNLILDNTRSLLGFLGVQSPESVAGHELNGAFVVSVSSEDKMGLLIGKNGQNISALEHLVRVLTYKRAVDRSDKLDGPINFSIDINDYRKIRLDQVLKVAREVARKVASTKRSEAMPPMNSYERRLVHAELSSFGDIETESVGEEPRRRVVVKPALEI